MLRSLNHTIKDRGDSIPSGQHGALLGKKQPSNRPNRFMKPDKPISPQESNCSSKQVWRVKYNEAIGSSFHNSNNIGGTTTSGANSAISTTVNNNSKKPIIIDNQANASI